MMAWRQAVVLLAASLAVLGGAAALNLEPCDGSHIHTYVGTVPPGQTPVLLTGRLHCPDGEATHALGGAFLPSDHHAGPICVGDAVVAEVTFSLARDGNGDGAITPQVAGDAIAGPYVTGACVRAPFEAGADGGWWVLIQEDGTHGTISST